MNNDTIYKIADDIGTPTFVIDIDELKCRMAKIKNILKDTSGDISGNIHLCYSIKANPFLIPYIDDYVDNFEVCSPGELEIIKHYGVSPKKIIYSGVNKEKDDVEEAINYGVSLITVESLKHFEIVNEVVKGKDYIIHVILRLTSGNQFGMSEEDIRDILKCAPYKNIAIDGIHYFAGTQRNNPKPQKKELDTLNSLILKWREEYMLPLNKLEYGPGLSYPYFETDDFSNTIRPLENIREYLSIAAQSCELTVEMGRFIASSCGYYLTKISDLKKSNDVNWCILDGGINHVNYYGQMMGMKRPIIRHLTMKRNEINSFEEADNYTLCGSLCTSNDVLVREMKMNSPNIGDVLVFENLGAYSVCEGINLFLSRDMAKIVIYNNGKVILARDTVHSWKINCQKMDELNCVTKSK